MTVNLVFFSFNACTSVHPELKAFPTAKHGMERFVIVLPHKEHDEYN